MRLRCYDFVTVTREWHRVRARWTARCVDLTLSASGDTMDAARSSLDDAIDSYIEAVCDTEDRGSIEPLLRRRSPWPFILWWHLLSWFAPQRTWTVTTRPPGTESA